MVKGCSAVLEADATWDARESESRRDRASRPRTRRPVHARTRNVPARGFAVKRCGMRITLSLKGPTVIPSILSIRVLLMDCQGEAELAKSCCTGHVQYNNFWQALRGVVALSSLRFGFGAVAS